MIKVPSCPSPTNYEEMKKEIFNESIYKYDNSNTNNNNKDNNDNRLNEFIDVLNNNDKNKEIITQKQEVENKFENENKN